MRWLVTGSGGMLGTDLVTLLRARGHDVTAAARASFDHTSLDEAQAAVAGHDVVVNCAGWTDVDAAEQHEDEASVANAVLPNILAQAVAAGGGQMVHVSTDYVFDGAATSPYSEDAPTSPVSVYGRTKAAGEEAVRRVLPGSHLILRTAWLYGAHGSCFPKTIARLARERSHLAVVDDQIGQPTWTCDVADLLIRLVEASAPAGTYHATSSGSCSWHEFAREVVSAAGLDPEIISPTTSDAFPRPAPRPANSMLSHDALVRYAVDPIGQWRDRWRVAAPSISI